MRTRPEAFALAATGLLDGRTATTHWRMADELARRYPKVEVRPHALYADHGDVATSAGTGAAVDLALELVRRDFGAAYAAEVARHMVLPPHRNGGQRQYARVSPRRDVPEEERLSSILEWAEAHLHEPISVGRLASRGGLAAHAGAAVRAAPRHDTGEMASPPAHPGGVLTARAHGHARGRGGSRRRIPDPSNFRRRFADELGTTPSAYRRTFTVPR